MGPEARQRTCRALPCFGIRLTGQAHTRPGHRFEASWTNLVPAADARPVLAALQALKGQTNLLREVGITLDRQERDLPFGRLLYFIQFVGQPIDGDAVSTAAPHQIL